MKRSGFLLIALLATQPVMLLAQALSSKTNDVYIRVKKDTGKPIGYPVIKWIFPREEKSRATGDSVEIVASVFSKTMLKSLAMHVTATDSSTTQEFILSGPYFAGEQVIKMQVGLIEGPNTVEIFAENANGGKVSSSRIIDVQPAPKVLAHERAAPPLLFVKENSVTFSDSNGNAKLEGAEEAVIEFIIGNKGLGDANRLVLNYSLTGDQGNLLIRVDSLLNLEPSKEQTVRARIYGGQGLRQGKAMIRFIVSEPNGLDSEPVEVGFDMEVFAAPSVVVADGFFNSVSVGKLKRNTPAALQVLIQNDGEGIAENVVMTYSLPENVLNMGESKVEIGRLLPGESKKMDLEFVVNSRYQSSEVPVKIILTEKLGKYGSERTFTATMDQPLASVQLNVKGEEPRNLTVAQSFLRSSVDTDIPVNEFKNPNRYALVIGNEDYSQFQPGLQREQNVAFARNDALIFRDYLVKTLGCPENQVYLLTDATKGQMSRELERLKQLVKLTPGSEIVFYYAGHGLPDFETRKGYLIPVDVSGANIHDGISLSDLYSQLASTNASRITVFLDACFSGGGRGENGLLAARTVKIKPTGDLVDGNIIVYTATSGEEVSLPLKRESHGLFTYHLLGKFNETRGNVTMQELKDYLEREVPRASLIENGMKQTPQLLTSPKLDNSWTIWKF